MIIDQSNGLNKTHNVIITNKHLQMNQISALNNPLVVDRLLNKQNPT